MQIGILDLGFSNIGSILKAISALGYSSKIIEKNQGAFKVDKLILPGVGHFQYAMRELCVSGLENTIIAHCHANKPLLGICLGMQLLFESSEEGEACSGLGLIPGKVERISSISHLEKIPHNGWNEVNFTNIEDPLWQSLDNGKDFYFNHSYTVKTSEEYVIGTTPFAGTIVSAIRKKNMCGVQFHPEKSQTLGQIILRNFITSND